MGGNQRTDRGEVGVSAPLQIDIYWDVINLNDKDVSPNYLKQKNL